MTEREPSGRTALEQLLWDHHDVLWNYPKKREEAEKFAEADASVDVMNQMLDKATQRFTTETNPFGPTKVYFVDSETQEIMQRSSIFTEGAGYIFVGDYVSHFDGELVLVNNEHCLGINICGPRFDVKSLEELAKFRKQERFNELLDMINESEPGEVTFFDCSFF